MALTFRKLRADEIDIRAGQIRDTYATLLLYKDARCDMNILDETVGAMNWTRQHSRDNANCAVSIWDSEKSMWISKEDTGTESNTEAEKGLASDSFKRACVNWGIGRELYTAPFIRVNNDQVTIVKSKTGRLIIKEDLVVQTIEYTGNSISRLVIATTDGNAVYTWPWKSNAQPPVQPQQPPLKPFTPPESKPVKVTQEEVFSPNDLIEDIKRRYNKDTEGVVQMRKDLIASGVIPDKPGKEMSKEDWMQFVRAVDAKFGT